MVDIPEENTSVELEMNHIDSLVSQLKQAEIRNPRNPKVTEALEIVHREMEGHVRDFFLAHGVLVTYHGSLLYNDPVQLDLDLVFTSKIEQTIQTSIPVIDRLCWRFEDLQGWPESGDNEGKCDTNFCWFSVEELVSHVTKHESKPIAYNWEDDTSDLEAAYMLTSACLYPEQKGLLSDFRDQVRDLLRHAPALRKQVIVVLDNAIQNRQKRANTDFEE